MSNFVREYAAGRTPIPCVHCNGDLKFATLAARAAAFGATSVATGHYARVEREAGRHISPEARPRCRPRISPTSSSRWISRSSSHALFPVGDLDKAAVRDHARDLGLPVAEKPDSHEICFVADGDHAGFLERHATMPGEGNVRDATGRVLGRHDGDSSIHRRPAQGSGPVIARAAVRHRDRRHHEQRHRRSPRRPAAREPDRITSELDFWCGTDAGHPRHRADPLSSSRGRRGGDSPSRRPRPRRPSTSRRRPSPPARLSCFTTGTLSLGAGGSISRSR